MLLLLLLLIVIITIIIIISSISIIIIIIINDESRCSAQPPSTIVNAATWSTLLSLSLFFLGLDRAQNTKVLPEVQFLYNDIDINGHCIDLPKGFSMC